MKGQWNQGARRTIQQSGGSCNCQIIADQMDLKIMDLGVDLGQILQDLDVPVPPVDTGDGR